MSYNPFADAKFLTGLFDALVSLALFFVGKYAPAAAEDTKFVISAIQPIFLMLVIGFFQRDQAAIRAGALPRFLTK